MEGSKQEKERIKKIFTPDKTFQRSGNKGKLPTRNQKPGPSKSKKGDSKKN
ncbi:hypothetical protein [Limosilactobacillus reuteri]|jgi:hypothetical protein|uniref:hypothetical protein n=1 Tax=Limosilactobacillus reuteri TaxID=1598 RepID=UPI001E5ADB09|nr:hypothetical protein [Limosilactobacillus reuteri]MCC4486337.1 hypothetical protein [Limosilactobacillus reuteri]